MRKTYDDDDGRVIVDMNVEGIRGYCPSKPNVVSSLTDCEFRLFLWYSVKQSLMLSLAFCLGVVLFVLFCQFVWLR